MMRFETETLDKSRRPDEQGSNSSLRSRYTSENPKNSEAMPNLREIVISLPNDQRQHHTLHIKKDVLPYALR